MPLIKLTSHFKFFDFWYYNLKSSFKRKKKTYQFKTNFNMRIVNINNNIKFKQTCTKCVHNV